MFIVAGGSRSEQEDWKESFLEQEIAHQREEMW